MRKINKINKIISLLMIICMMNFVQVCADSAEVISIFPADGSAVLADTVQLSAQCSQTAKKAVFILDGVKLAPVEISGDFAEISLQENMKYGKHILEVVFTGDNFSAYKKSEFIVIKSEDTVHENSAGIADMTLANNAASNPGGGELSLSTRSLDKAWKINLGTKIYNSKGPYIDLTNNVFSGVKTTSSGIVHFTFDVKATHTGAGMKIESGCYNEAGISSHIGIKSISAMADGKLADGETSFEADKWYSFDYMFDTENNIISVSVDGEELIRSDTYTSDQYNKGLALIRLRVLQYECADSEAYPGGGYIVIDNMKVISGDNVFTSTGDVNNITFVNNASGNPGGGEISLENTTGKNTSGKEYLSVNLGKQVYTNNGPYIDLNLKNFPKIIVHNKCITTFNFDLYASHIGAGLMIESRCFNSVNASSYTGIKNIKAIYDGKLAQTSKSFNPGKWYSFKYVFDTVSNKITVYVDDEKLQEMQYTSAEYNKGMSLLRFRFFQTVASNNSFILLDNMNVVTTSVKGTGIYAEYLKDGAYVAITDETIPYGVNKLRFNSDILLSDVKVYENGELIDATINSVSDTVKEITVEKSFLAGSEIKLSASEAEFKMRVGLKDSTDIKGIFTVNDTPLYVSEQLKAGDTVSVYYNITGDTGDYCTAITVFDGNVPVCSDFAYGTELSVTLPDNSGNYTVESFVFKDISSKIPVSAQIWNVN